MEKKAEIAMKYVIYFGLALSVLVVVLLFLLGPGKNVIIDKFKILFPSGNGEVQGTEQIQIIRYNILEDTIEFYDGLDWTSFENQPSVLLGDIEIEYQKTLSTLGVGYWYDNSRRTGQKTISRIRTLELYDSPTTYDLSITVPLRQDNLPWKRGDLPANLLAVQFTQDGEEITRTYAQAGVDISNTLYLRKVTDFTLFDLSGNRQPVFENSDIYAKIAQPMIDWRDSVLLKPVRLNYKERQGRNSVEKTDSYCPEKEDFSLVIDLSNPQDTCT